MNVNWTDPALGDLRAIWDYIAIDDEAAADRMFERLTKAGEALTMYPRRGRRGRRRSVYELPVSGTPYILIYRVSRRDVHILRIMHGARNRPR